MQSSRGLLQPGHVVAEKYVISRLLGRGGMGAVYVVEHRVTGKKLALKCLLPEHLEHPEFVERFLREAQAAGRIEHRNVVDVFDVGRESDLIYIVMELLDGKPLSELLRAGQLSLEETLQILLRAMDGVAAAHAVGIVHRDLKPDNILVCVGQSGRLDDPRVLDFGISKLEDDVSKPLTKSGVMLGTPYYMAFEQINSQRDLDQRVDVYAMGVILYESMAGRPPYVAESVGALAIRMMSGPPTPLAELRPELPSGLSDVVMRSVARDRNQRYPTMNALMAALRPYAPDSANILTPLGQGTPMGTIRSSQPMAIDATMPALRSPIPPPGSSSLPPQRTPLPPTSMPMNMPTPTSRLRLSDTEGRTPSVVTSSRSVLWMVGLGLLAVLIVGGVLLALGDESEPPVAQQPPPAVPVPEPAAATTPTPAPEKPTPTEPAAPAEAAPEPEPIAAEPAAVEPAEPAKAKGTRGRKRKGRGKAEESEPAADEPYVPAGTGMEPVPAAKAEPAARPEPEPEAPAAEAAKPEAPKPEAPKPEAPKPEAPKPEALPAEAPAAP